ncbi:MAG: acetate kinase [Clostridia bacterium]
MKVLVVNAGSSSVKAQLMESTTGEVFAKFYCQRVGLSESFTDYKTTEKRVIKKDLANHREAFQLIFDTLMDSEIGVISSLDEIKAIGHRGVNFGEDYKDSFVVTDKALEDMKANVGFAPLHSPAIITGVEVCRELMPNIKNVVVLDISFHTTMPESSYIYPIPYEFYENNKVRRYGAHGTSHRYIAMQCEKMFGDLNGKKIISCHIGSGSSLCAIKDGKCLDTTMGFTPLAGIVMGTRSGDIDPSIVKAIMDIKGVDINGAIDILNKKSGLSGICGYSDLRDIDDNLDQPRVKLAFDLLVNSIKKYIGAYSAEMNGVDYIVFTAGVGENDSLVREAVCKNMEYLGIDFDFDKNNTAPRGEVTKFTKEGSKVEVWRIPTDEEFVIAMDTAELSK